MLNVFSYFIWTSGPRYNILYLLTCRTRREFGAWCRLVAIPFSSILPWRLQYGTHLEQNCFRFHQNPWPRQDAPLSCIYCIYSLLWGTRVLAATTPTLGGTLDIGVMTTDIPAQQPGTAALLTGGRCLHPTNNSTQQSGAVNILFRL